MRIIPTILRWSFLLKMTFLIMELSLCARLQAQIGIFNENKLSAVAADSPYAGSGDIRQERIAKNSCLLLSGQYGWIRDNYSYREENGRIHPQDKKIAVPEDILPYRISEKARLETQGKLKMKRLRFMLYGSFSFTILLAVFSGVVLRRLYIMQQKIRILAGEADEWFRLCVWKGRRSPLSVWRTPERFIPKLPVLWRKIAGWLAPKCPSSVNIRDYQYNKIINSQDFIIFEKLDREIRKNKLYLRSGISRDGLARLAGVDKNRFARIVLHNTGKHLSGYLNEMRLEQAANLMKEHPDYIIYSIALESGFHNVRTFHRLFREHFGMTPSEYKTALLMGRY